MSGITVKRGPGRAELEAMGVFSWPVWTKEASEFPWTYDDRETCYLLEGEVEVTPEGGEPVRFGTGDLVVFPQGMSCTWKVIKPVKKHYDFGQSRPIADLRETAGQDLPQIPPPKVRKWARMSFKLPSPAMSREAGAKEFESPENFPKVFWPPEAETLQNSSEKQKKRGGRQSILPLFCGLCQPDQSSRLFLM